MRELKQKKPFNYPLLPKIFGLQYGFVDVLEGCAAYEFTFQVIYRKI